MFAAGIRFIWDVGLILKHPRWGALYLTGEENTISPRSQYPLGSRFRPGTGSRWLLTADAVLTRLYGKVHWGSTKRVGREPSAATTLTNKLTRVLVLYHVPCVHVTFRLPFALEYYLLMNSDELMFARSGDD